MAKRPKRAASRPRRKRHPLGRRAWLDAAKRALIEEGTAGVEVNKLAKRLGVSRGGFYWFFRDREQLLEELVKYWAETSTHLYERILEPRRGDGLREYQALSELWIDESEYDPRWDGAVRDWARTSSAVRRVVEAVDRKRIEVIRQICLHLGYKGEGARVRARVIYYHQVGYYAMGVTESKRQRWKLVPYYMRVLIGRDAK